MVGEHAPLHLTAVSKAMLAFPPDKQRKALLTELRLERFTEHTITEPAQLEHGLQAVREQGYAESDREEFLQVCGIAAPLRDDEGQVAAAVCLWMPTAQASRDDLRGFVQALLGASEGISTRLGRARH